MTGKTIACESARFLVRIRNSSFVVRDSIFAMLLYQNFRWGLGGEPQAMLVDEGRVVDRGRDVVAVGCDVVDLGGRYMLPGFVDCHCHVLPAGLNYGRLNLDDCRSHQDVLDAVRDWARDHSDGWVLAVRYNQIALGGEHVTRDQLDSVVKGRPVMLDHVSGHASVANSAALQAAGIDEGTPDPEGGEFQRDESGRLTGVLLEEAHEVVQRAVPSPTLDQMVDAIMLAGERLRAMGITCASDMMTGFYDLEQELQAYQIAASKGCPIHVRCYVQWKTIFGPRGTGIESFRERTADLGEGVRIAGVKLFADGALSSGTAAIYGRFTDAPKRGRRVSRHARPAVGPEGVEVDGHLIYSRERLAEMVRKAHEAGLQAATHSIGDFSTDLVLDVYESTGEPSRHRIEHAMMLNDHQIDRFSRLNIPITFQPEFLLRLGNAYLRQLGPERTATLIRTRSVLDAGIRVGFSSDLPVVPGNPWDGVLAASDRPSIYDSSENCTRLEAIKLYTEGAAEANGDADAMGALTPGQYAHFNLFDQDPLRERDPGLHQNDDGLNYLAA